MARPVRAVKQHMFNGGQVPAAEARVLTYAGLLSIARERGYKVGWAGMKYRAIYGKWPEGQPEPVNPSGELMWWIKKQGKEWAKAKRAEEGPKKPLKSNNSALMSQDDWEVDL